MALLEHDRYGCSDVEMMKQVVYEILAMPERKVVPNKIIRAMCVKYPKLRMELRNNTILMTYRVMVAEGSIPPTPWMETKFIKTQGKTESGVAVVAVMTSAYPNGRPLSCGHNCHMCPDPALPDPTSDHVVGDPDDEPARSYPSLGPLAQRARQEKFDAVGQFMSRATSLLMRGHPVDKVEIKVSGGTISNYPYEEYLIPFFRDLYYAANNMHALVEKKSPPRTSPHDELMRNENAEVRVVGVTVETRPDYTTPRELKRFIEMGGVTRVEVGIQHTDDAVLERINREATDRDSHNAMLYLYACGFKCVIHIMPDLPQVLTPEAQDRVEREMKQIPHPRNSVPYRMAVREIMCAVDPERDVDNSTHMLEKDRVMMNKILERGWGDEWKVYPHQATKYTSVPQWYEKGIYKSYYDELVLSEEEMAEYEHLDSLQKSSACLRRDARKRLAYFRHKCNKLYLFLKNEVAERIPEHVRVDRLGRDIPGQDVVGGLRASNVRQYIMEDFAKEGRRMRDIFTRELKGRTFRESDVHLRWRHYTVQGDPTILDFAIDQIHIEVCAEDDKLLGYLRLGFPPKKAPSSMMRNVYHYFPELRGTAMIRQLEVLGKMTVVGTSATSAQHRGYGTRLLHAAFNFARRKGFKKIAVITSPGTRGYYRRFGFREEGSFMIKHFAEKGWRTTLRDNRYIILSIVLAIAVYYAIVVWMFMKT